VASESVSQRLAFLRKTELRAGTEPDTALRIVKSAAFPDRPILLSIARHAHWRSTGRMRVHKPQSEVFSRDAFLISKNCKVQFGEVCTQFLQMRQSAWESVADSMFPPVAFRTEADTGIDLAFHS
jgi:hypothetical protein